MQKQTSLVCVCVLLCSSTAIAMTTQCTNSWNLRSGPPSPKEWATKKKKGAKTRRVCNFCASLLQWQSDGCLEDKDHTAPMTDGEIAVGSKAFAAQFASLAPQNTTTGSEAAMWSSIQQVAAAMAAQMQGQAGQP